MMKITLLVVSFFLLVSISKGQSSDRSLAHINHFIPASVVDSTANIAKWLNENFNNDEPKIEAAYLWVIANIRYDTDSSNQINLGENTFAKITEALRRKKGVCENFAWIFSDILKKAGIRAIVIDGYTRQSGSIDKTGHSWVAVNLRNEWYLCDPTWDAGMGTSSKYFLNAPADFIETHMPFDPLWQLLPYVISHEQFASGNIYNSTAAINYADSVEAYLKLDSLEKFSSSAARISHSGIKNNLLKNNLNYNKMQVEMIHQDRDIALYNSAVADLNILTSRLNAFINFRNNRFLPERSDAEMQAVFSGIDIKFHAAERKLNNLDKSPATFAISSEPVRQKLKGLQLRIREQREFLKNYLALNKVERPNYLYK